MLAKKAHLWRLSITDDDRLLLEDVNELLKDQFHQGDELLSINDIAVTELLSNYRMLLKVTRAQSAIRVVTIRKQGTGTTDRIHLKPIHSSMALKRNKQK